jgi:hypothetical protein
MVELRHCALKAPIIPIICEVSALRNLIPFNLLGLLFVSAIATASVSAQQVTPDPGSPVILSMAGLHDTVTVRRDARGIPYIDAEITMTCISHRDMSPQAPLADGSATAKCQG